MHNRKNNKSNSSRYNKQTIIKSNYDFMGIFHIDLRIPFTIFSFSPYVCYIAKMIMDQVKCYEHFF